MLNSNQKHILESISNKLIDEAEMDFSFLEIHDELNSKLWDGDTLKPEVKTKLLQIAKEFVDYLGVNVQPLDIVFVGSMANYNWSESSDIDLHVILDFEKIGDKESILELIKGKSKYWNETHNIKIKGVEVELNAEDVDNKRFSAGVYSLKKDKWLSKPDKGDLPTETDLEKIESKVKKYSNLIKSYVKKSDYEKLDKLKSSLKQKRQESLEKEGEYGLGNVIFKTLRREGMIKKMIDYLRQEYDKQLSLEQNTLTEQMQFDDLSYSEDKAKEVFSRLYKVIDKKLPAFNETLTMNIRQIMSMSMEELKTSDFSDLVDMAYQISNEASNLYSKLEELDDMIFDVKTSYEDRGFGEDLQMYKEKVNGMMEMINKNHDTLRKLISLSETIKENLTDNEQ